MKKRILISLAAIVMATFSGCSNQNDGTTASASQIETRGAVHVDNVPFSRKAPAGLKPEETPLFISFGFDDNAYPDAMVWIRDFMRNQTNFIEGTGNPKNFDGQTAKATFFMTGQYMTNSGLIPHGGNTLAKMSTTLKSLYNDGHEIANHTYKHTDDKSIAELTRCNDAIVSMGIPRDAIVGFRAPNLHYTDAAFQNLYQMGFLYDCTIEENWDNNKTGKDDAFPFTLDNGSPFQSGPVIGKYPGMWELPVFTLHVEGQNRIEAAFDYNLWVTRKLNKAEFVKTLKDALDARIEGNRAPFLFGAHTDEYSEFNLTFDTTHTPNSTWQERRAAIEEFLIYAMSKPQVRIVTHKQVIDWMRDPQPLTGSAVIKPTPRPDPDPTMPVWDATKVYKKGNNTKYDNYIWVANWWTQGEVPGAPDSNGAWSRK